MGSSSPDGSFILLYLLADVCDACNTRTLLNACVRSAIRGTSVPLHLPGGGIDILSLLRRAPHPCAHPISISTPYAVLYPVSLSRAHPVRAPSYIPSSWSGRLSIVCAAAVAARGYSTKLLTLSRVCTSEKYNQVGFIGGEGKEKVISSLACLPEVCTLHGALQDSSLRERMPSPVREPTPYPNSRPYHHPCPYR